MIAFLNTNVFNMGMNWKILITQLEQMGLAREEIAKQASCSVSLINSLANGSRGKNLGWAHGDNLIRLYRKATGKKSVLSITTYSGEK